MRLAGMLLSLQGDLCSVAEDGRNRAGTTRAVLALPHENCNFFRSAQSSDGPTMQGAGISARATSGVIGSSSRARERGVLQGLALFDGFA